MKQKTQQRVLAMNPASPSRSMAYPCGYRINHVRHWGGLQGAFDTEFVDPEEALCTL